MEVSVYAGGNVQFFNGIGIDTGVLEELRCTLALGRFWEERGNDKEADEKFRQFLAQVRLVRVYYRGHIATDSAIEEMLEQLETEIDEHGVEWALTKPEHRS